ncbi:MAG TPA: glycosyltransferase family 39 protein [Vicinamibacterales bacterium]|nr:glycosyltransferase family 39 protein [Vicinamibacterales bacterium]
MRRALRAKGAAGIVFATLALGLVWLLASTPMGSLRRLLMDWQFWILEIQFLLLLGLTLINARPLHAQLGATPRVYGVVFLASLLAWTLTTTVAPRTSRIFYDEQIYQNAGQLLADGHRAAMCNEGDVDYGSLRCTRAEYNKQPYGYPYLLSIGYRLFGVQEGIAFRLNNLNAAALVWVVFALSALLFRDTTAAVLSALMMATIPHQLRWTNTAASEPTAALFCGVAAMAAVLFARNGTTPALLWAVAATAFAATVRPETPMIAAVAGAAIALLAPWELRSPRLWWAAVLGLILLAPTITHVASVRAEPWGAPGERMSLQFFGENLKVNGPFYFQNQHFPALYALLGVMAVATRRHWRSVAVLLVYAALFWGIFLFFYAGSYAYGADVRYSLLSYIPFIALAGPGGSALIRMIETRMPQFRGVVAPALCGLILFQFLSFLPLVRSLGEESWAARADVAVARDFAATIPRNAIVLTHNPGMFLLWGVNAAQVGIAYGEEPYVREFVARRYPGGVYFHWNFWCNVDDPRQIKFCDEILERYPADLVREHRDRSYRYALYRLRLDPPVTPSDRQ